MRMVTWFQPGVSDSAKKNDDAGFSPVVTASGNSFEAPYEAEHRQLEEAVQELTLLKQKNLELSVKNERLSSTPEKMMHVALAEFPEFCSRQKDFYATARNGLLFPFPSENDIMDTEQILRLSR